MDMEGDHIVLFGHYIPNENKGLIVRSSNARYWSCTWTLQIFKDNRLWNGKIVKKLENRNGITLSSVCQWVASYDGILKSITTENQSLEFNIRIFSKRNYEKFCHLLAENQIESDFQPILLDKELLENSSRSRYHIKMLHYSSSHTVCDDRHEGYESDDSAFSSINPDHENLVQASMPTEEWINMQIEMKEFKQKITEHINESFKAIFENLNEGFREVSRKMEKLNEDVKGSDAQTEKMSSGRFQHVFQKIEFLRRQHEQTYSKVVQLESTTTETNALVYELHQKVDSLRRTVQQSSQQQSGEIRNKPSECTRIKEQLAMIVKAMDDSLTCKLCPQSLSREQLTLKTEENLPDFRQPDQTNVGASGNSNLPENIEFSPSMSTKSTNSDTIQEKMLRMAIRTETSELKGGMDGLSSCEYNDMIYPFYSEEQILKQVPNNFSPEPNRLLSPTLEKAISEYGSELFVSDDEEGRELIEGRSTESTFSEEEGDTESHHNIINETDGNDHQNLMKKEYCIDRASNVSDLGNSKLVTRTIEEVPEENTYINDAKTQVNSETDGNIVDEEVSHSECDTDIEETLRASGLSKSKPVIRAVKKALKIDQEESRLHGLDTMLCVDVSASMTSKVLEQVKSTILSFLDVIEEVAIDEGLEENLGLTVFGAETKIVIQLTNDYSKLRQEIENLRLGGTSPIHTALSLCRLELQRNGHATCIHEHCIAPRIILFTDGRVTRDSCMDMSESEHAPKDPEKFEEITTFVQQLGREGYQLFTIGTGRQTNKEFLEGLANLGGGKYFDLDNISVLTKHFIYQFIVGKVIHKCRESADGSWKMDYKTQLQQIIRTQKYRIGQDDIDHIEELLLLSEELTDVEYPGLPKLGSRVKTRTGEIGTVVKHRKLNWIKIQLDSGEILYWHYIQNAQNDELTTIDDPRRGIDEADVCVGMMVVRGDPTNIKQGYIYDRLNSKFVKVKWQDGLREIMKIRDLQLYNGSQTDL